MGRYNGITQKVISDIFEIVKVHKYYKDRLTDELICQVTYEYDCETYGLEFDLMTQLKKIDTDYRFKLDACVFDNDGEQVPVMLVEVSSSDFSNESMYSDLYFELRDVIRHEIEHLTQRGINQKTGKWMRDNQGIREKILLDELPQYRYFTLQDEVDANIQGLFSKSRALKQPFQIVIDEYLDKLIEDGKVDNKEERDKIYKIWKKRIPKIGGIPKLK